MEPLLFVRGEATSVGTKLISAGEESSRVTDKALLLSSSRAPSSSPSRVLDAEKLQIIYTMAY